MELKDFFGAGSEILDEVTKAIDNNDYSNLSKSVKISVSKMTQNASNDLSRMAAQTQQNVRSYSSVTQSNGTTIRTFSSQAAAAPDTPFLHAHPGKTGYMVAIILGSVWGICWFLLGLIVLLALAVGMDSSAIGFLIFCFSFSALGAFAVFRGSRGLNFIKRYYHYGAVIGNKEYFAIDDLVKFTGRSKSFLQKDLQKMADKGYLPQLRSDNSRSTYMLTENVYQEYLELDRKQKELAEQKKQEDADLAASGNAAAIRSILEEGDAYLKTIHTCNDEIPDDVMSDKLYKLEEIMTKIFAQVKKQPKSADDLHKFMNYYLPTTTKLLYAYIDLEKQPEVGENITNTKKEIEATLDTINLAFEKLLDSLFQDLAWDISSDISVMKTMLARDGLTGGADFNKVTS